MSGRADFFNNRQIYNIPVGYRITPYGPNRYLLTKVDTNKDVWRVPGSERYFFFLEEAISRAWDSAGEGTRH